MIKTKFNRTDSERRLLDDMIAYSLFLLLVSYLETGLSWGPALNCAVADCKHGFRSPPRAPATDRNISPIL